MGAQVTMMRSNPIPAFLVIPAQAGIQSRNLHASAATSENMDSRLRGNDGVGL
jgi:hypothetical protein